MKGKNSPGGRVGSEKSSDGSSPRHHSYLAVQVVRGEELRKVAP